MASVEKVLGLNGRVRGHRARWRDAEGRSRRRLFKKKHDADRHIAVVAADLARGAYVDAGAGRMTVGEWAKAWRAGKVNLKPKSAASLDSLLSTRVLPRWGAVPLSGVSNAGVTAWIAGMRADGLSASRIRQSYHTLHAMLDGAVRDGRISKNPAAGVDLPRLSQSDRRYLTHRQLRDLAEASGRDRALVLLLGYCGLRWGEAAALRTRNVDLDRRRLRVVE